MDEASLRQTVNALASRRPPVLFEVGLSDQEVAEVQSKWGFVFPPDLRQFLQFALPVSHHFVDWRRGDESAIRFGLDGPADGICFDIEYNDFWWLEWGPRPTDVEEAKALAKEYVDSAPKLIPISGNRYLPAEPSEEGNPVVSVHQTDIIYDGENLIDYIQNEFWTSFDRGEWIEPRSPRRIRFWSDVIEANSGGLP